VCLYCRVRNREEKLLSCTRPVFHDLLRADRRFPAYGFLLNSTLLSGRRYREIRYI